MEKEQNQNQNLHSDYSALNVNAQECVATVDRFPDNYKDEKSMTQRVAVVQPSCLETVTENTGDVGNHTAKSDDDDDDDDAVFEPELELTQHQPCSNVHSDYCDKPVDVSALESPDFTMETLQRDCTEDQENAAAASSIIVEADSGDPPSLKSSKSPIHQRFKDYLKRRKKPETVKISSTNSAARSSISQDLERLHVENLFQGSKNSSSKFRKLSSAISSFVVRTSSTFGMTKKKVEVPSSNPAITEQPSVAADSSENLSPKFDKPLNFSRSKSGPLPLSSEKSVTHIETIESATSVNENIGSSQSAGKGAIPKRQGSWLSLKVAAFTSQLSHRHRRSRTKIAESSKRPLADKEDDGIQTVGRDIESRDTHKSQLTDDSNVSISIQQHHVSSSEVASFDTDKDNRSTSPDVSVLGKSEPCRLSVDPELVSSNYPKEARYTPIRFSVPVDNKLLDAKNSHKSNRKCAKEPHRLSMPSLKIIFSKQNSFNGSKVKNSITKPDEKGVDKIQKEIPDVQLLSADERLFTPTTTRSCQAVSQFSSQPLLSADGTERQFCDQNVLVDKSNSSLQKISTSSSHLELQNVRGLSSSCDLSSQRVHFYSLDGDNGLNSASSGLPRSVSSVYSEGTARLSQNLVFSSPAGKSNSLPKKKPRKTKPSSFVHFLRSRTHRRSSKHDTYRASTEGRVELGDQPKVHDPVVCNSMGQNINGPSEEQGNDRRKSLSVSMNDAIRSDNNNRTDFILVNSETCQDKSEDEEEVAGKILETENIEKLENDDDDDDDADDEGSKVEDIDKDETKFKIRCSDEIAFSSCSQNVGDKAFFDTDKNLQDNLKSAFENKIQLTDATSGVDELPSAVSAGKRDGESAGNIFSRIKLLQASQNEWRTKVGEKDAEKFTVQGRMSTRGKSVGSALMQRNEGASSASMLKDIHERAKSVSTEASRNQSSVAQESNSALTGYQKSKVSAVSTKELPIKDVRTPTNSLSSDRFLVEIPQMDSDVDAFFATPKDTKNKSTPDEVFENIDIKREPFLQSAQKIRPVRKQTTSGNPIKKLAERSDILTSYTESRPNVSVARELAKKLEDVKSASGFTPEARAGLATKEDLSKVSLRKSESSLANNYPPYKEKMLVQFKGRRFCQPRLVRPCADSVNSGDSFVLVTTRSIHVWLGEFCNVIERAKAIEFAKHIFKTHDLGCKALSEPVIFDKDGSSGCKDDRGFWTTLCGVASRVQAKDAGPAKEDEIYEELMYSTNIVYKFRNGCLHPLDQFCGKLLACDAVDATTVLVFDFGAEMYVWIGKQSPRSDRQTALSQAKELWERGYDYTAFKINPLSPFHDETNGGVPLKSSLRPSWAVFGRINQGTETILFKDKFVDWGDSSRLINLKGFSTGSESNVRSSDSIQPCDVQKMMGSKREPLYIVLDGVKVARETKWVEECDGLKMEYILETEGIDVWRVAEFDHHLLDPAYHGHFDSDSTYVIRWYYKLEVKGLGTRNRALQSGRSRCVYFFWHGSHSSVTEKGACAMMTVELDAEKGPQIRVVQNKEPPGFLMLFRGRMIVHKARKSSSQSTESGCRWRLYIVRNELPNDAYLMEVDVGLEHLRSRSSFLLLNAETGQLTVWHGAKSPECTKERARELRSNLQNWASLKLVADREISIDEVHEGSENTDFLKAMGSLDRSQYDCLLRSSMTLKRSVRVFLLSSLSGSFDAIEIHNPSFSADVPFAPFSVLQSDIYIGSQPALFLVDACDVVYLWQGYWSEENPRTGSAVTQFNIDKRCAFETVLAYCQAVNSADPLPAYVVYAGVEPVSFTNLFPSWSMEPVARESSIKDGKIIGEKTPVTEVLKKSATRQYSFKELTQIPLPDGVDPLKLETYLNDEEFKNIFCQSKAEFYSLPIWKQKEAKKQLQLF